MSPPICCCQVLRWRHSTRYMPWFLPSQSHLHSLEAALISSCCPGPFSIMFLTHSFFFSNSYILFFFIFMKQFPILLPFVTLGIQFYMHVHICTHTLCLYKENLNKIKHQSNKTKTYSSITGPKKFQQYHNIC